MFLTLALCYNICVSILKAFIFTENTKCKEWKKVRMMKMMVLGSIFPFAKTKLFDG